MELIKALAKKKSKASKPTERKIVLDEKKIKAFKKAFNKK